MNENRLYPHDASALGIEANVGIEMVMDNQMLHAIPRRHPDADDPAPAPFHLPPIPAPLIEDKARLLRKLWTHGRAGVWALYIDTAPPHEWHAYLPPQFCCGTDIRANLSYPRCQVPGPRLRLAGTFRSAPFRSPDELMAELPPIQGIHLFWHAESWMLLSAFLMIGDTPQVAFPHQLLVDPIDPGLQELSQRLWGLDLL